MFYDLNYFLQKKYSFVLINQGKIIYKSKGRGLKPLTFCFKNYRRQMCDSIIFDKVVGRAAALILAEARVGQVLTPLVSEEAIKILRAEKIKVEFGKKVKKILNRAGDGLCPMERNSAGKSFKEFKKVLKF